jgi:cytochrome c553
MQDYIDAHGTERYGGVDIENYPPIAPFALERFVNRRQPLLFDTVVVEDERWPKVNGKYPARPQLSPTWERAYDAFKRGEHLALPYYEVRATDPQKQARLTAAYRAFSEGETDELPDLADIFPDDPHVRARIGLETEPGASAVALLIQACGPCHNDVLDQSLTRARFNINLSRVAAKEIDAAIERLKRGPHDGGVMPPPDSRQLSAQARERLLEYLDNQGRRREAVPELVEASAYGMALGTR